MNSLTKTLVRGYDTFIDQQINKLGAVNKPFKALQRQEDFKKFKTMFSDGIKDQGKWVTDNLLKLMDSAGINDDLQPLTLEQSQKLRGLIQRDMPKLTEYVSELKTFQMLKSFFEWSAKQQYKRWGYIVKGDSVEFNLSNPKYIAELQKRAAYLMNQSSLDQTTIDDVINMVSEGKLDGMTNDEVGQMLSDRMDEISSSRGDMIARTEAANASGDANYATALENGAQTHSWVAAGGADNDVCADNEDDGDIPIDQAFSSGDMSEPAHPNCECYTEAGEINLDAIDIWKGE